MAKRRQRPIPNVRYVVSTKKTFDWQALETVISKQIPEKARCEFARATNDFIVKSGIEKFSPPLCEAFEQLELLKQRTEKLKGLIELKGLTLSKQISALHAHSLIKKHSNPAMLKNLIAVFDRVITQLAIEPNQRPSLTLSNFQLGTCGFWI